MKREGLNYGDYVCRCPLCGDGVLVEDNIDTGNAVLMCQYCGEKLEINWSIEKRRASIIFKQVNSDIIFSV